MSDIDIDQPLYENLRTIGFRRASILIGRQFEIEVDLRAEAAVYVGVLADKVFWVGETGNIRRRFQSYQRWFAQPDDSRRKDRKTRDQCLTMTGGAPLVFLTKKPMQVWSDIANKYYDGHRVEEVILIEYFKPAWNMRPGGRKKG